MAGNANFSTLIATTLQKFTNKLMDSVVTNNALLFMLRRSDNIKIDAGGRQFIEQLLFKVNQSFQARGSLDPVSLPITDSVSASQWDIKIIDGSITLPYLDVAMNAGDKEKLLDLVNSKKFEAEVSMGEVLGDQVFGNQATSNDFDGLQRLISEDPTSQSDVGGIDSTGASQGYWRNYSHDTVVSAFNNTAQAGWNAIDTSINESTFGKMGPTFIVTTKAIWTLAQLGLTANQRYASADTPLGKAGFKALQYAGIPLVFDDNCPVGNLYGVDTNAIRLRVLSQGNMKQTPFQPSHTQLLESALLYFFGNMTAALRRTSFVVDSITG